MATIGIEWVNKYHGRAHELNNNDENARGFCNTLQGVKAFEYGDDVAWDEDFEQPGAGAPPAGTDQTYADNVDICFFSGHGTRTGAMFGIASHDDGWARFSEMRLGDQQLEWLVLDACECLADDSGAVYNRVRPIFTGVHMILGFHTTTNDSASRGMRFSQYLNSGERVRDAWIHACEDTAGSAVQWAYVRADATGTNTYEDHWWGKGYVSPDPLPPVTLFYARGAC